LTVAPGLADLHVHSTASDGDWTPRRLVREAAVRGLSYLALTDHDTMAGVAAAQAAAREADVRVVPGLELGTDHGAVEVHLLGYFLDPAHAALNRELARLVCSRRERAELMVRRLGELGYSVDPEEVAARAGGGAVGRPHLAAALVARGYVRDVDQAFSELLGRGRPAYVPRYKPSPLAALDLIRTAGGAAVLAHPGLYQEAAAELLPALVESGLVGLEVYYPSHGPDEITTYLDWCRRFSLVPTGGSDFHGPGRHGNAELGTCGVTAGTVPRLAALARGS